MISAPEIEELSRASRDSRSSTGAERVHVFLREHWKTSSVTLRIQEEQVDLSPVPRCSGWAAESWRGTEPPAAPPSLLSHHPALHLQQLRTFSTLSERRLCPLGAEPVKLLQSQRSSRSWPAPRDLSDEPQAHCCPVSWGWGRAAEAVACLAFRWGAASLSGCTPAAWTEAGLWEQDGRPQTVADLEHPKRSLS